MSDFIIPAIDYTLVFEAIVDQYIATMQTHVLPLHTSSACTALDNVENIPEFNA